MALQTFKGFKFVKVTDYELEISGNSNDVEVMFNNIRERVKGKYIFSKARILPLKGKRTENDKVKIWGSVDREMFNNMYLYAEGSKVELRPNNYKSILKKLKGKEVKVYVKDKSIGSIIRVLKKLIKNNQNLDFTYKEVELFSTSDIINSVNCIYLDSYNYINEVGELVPAVRIKESETVIGYFYLLELYEQDDAFDLIIENLNSILEYLDLADSTEDIINDIKEYIELSIDTYMVNMEFLKCIERLFSNPDLIESIYNKLLRIAENQNEDYMVDLALEEFITVKEIDC